MIIFIKLGNTYHPLIYVNFDNARGQNCEIGSFRVYNVDMANTDSVWDVLGWADSVV